MGVRLTTLTQKQIEQIKLDAVKQATEKVSINAVNLAMYLPFLILHDKFGFGKVRLQRMSDNVNEYVDSFNRGYVTLDDLKEEVDKLGIGLRRE